MVSHHHAKFNAYKHCGSGDMTFLMVEENYCLFLKQMACDAHLHKIWDCKHNNLPVFLVKDVKYW